MNTPNPARHLGAPLAALSNAYRSPVSPSVKPTSAIQPIFGMSRPQDRRDDA